MLGIGINIAKYTSNQDGIFPTENVFLAFSMVKVVKEYSGPIIRVRRDSDNVEQDFGLVDGVLDRVAISTFCQGGGGSNIGYITTWYDQSSNAYHVTQSVGNRQPRIYDSTIGGIDQVYSYGGIPISRWNATSTRLLTTFSEYEFVNGITHIAMIGITNLADYVYYVDGSTARRWVSGITSSGGLGRRWGIEANSWFVTPTTGFYYFYGIRSTVNDRKLWEGRTLRSTDTPASGNLIVNGIALGGHPSTDSFADLKGYIGSLIILNKDYGEDSFRGKVDNFILDKYGI